MNKDTLLTVVRTVLIAIGGIFAAKGKIQGSDVEAIAGSIASLIGAIWVAVAHKKALDTPVPATPKAPDAK